MNMSSGLASMGLDHGETNATYSISKTALGMLVRNQLMRSVFMKADTYMRGGTADV